MLHELLHSESETARARRPWQASSRQYHVPELWLPISWLPSLPSCRVRSMVRIRDSLKTKMALPACCVLTMLLPS
jgi:hypothetical protein